MNKVMLIGRFTSDPESRMTQSNMEVSRFSLACSSDFVNRNGEKETEFINCVAFNRTASTINRYCKKGQLISVTGRIRNSSYDAQDGTKRYTTDVVVDNFEFLGSKNITLIFSLIIGIIVYIAFLILLKILSKDDIHMLPYGNKVYKTRQLKYQ